MLAGGHRRCTVSSMHIDKALEHLQRIAILASVDVERLRCLAGDLIWRNVAPNEEIISLLSADTHVYFIAEGEFRVRLAPLPGRGVLIRQLHPGQCFGEIAVLAQGPRSASVSAQTAGLIAQCPADVFCQLLREDGSVGLAVAARLARNVVSLTDRLYETAALEVRFRIHAEVLRLAKTAEETAEGLVIHNAPTHSAIAQSVGTHREAVTKEFGFLTEQAVLRQTGRQLRIVDLEKLRELIRKNTGLLASQFVDW